MPITIDDMDAPLHLKRNCITDNAQPPPRFNVCFPASGMIARRDIREPSARNKGIYDANCSMKIYCYRLAAVRGLSSVEGSSFVSRVDVSFFSHRHRRVLIVINSNYVVARCVFAKSLGFHLLSELHALAICCSRTNSRCDVLASSSSSSSSSSLL